MREQRERNEGVSWVCIGWQTTPEMANDILVTEKRVYRLRLRRFRASVLPFSRDARLRDRK